MSELDDQSIALLRSAVTAARRGDYVAAVGAINRALSTVASRDDPVDGRMLASQLLIVLSMAGLFVQQAIGKLGAALSVTVPADRAQEVALSTSEERPPAICSFCGKAQHEVLKMVAGPDVFICNECVELCLDIYKEDGVPFDDGKV